MLPRAIASLAAAGVCCLSSVGAATEPAISAQPVPEDRYPEARIGFPGGVVGFPDLVYAVIPVRGRTVGTHGWGNCGDLGRRS